MRVRRPSTERPEGTRTNLRLSRPSIPASTVTVTMQVTCDAAIVGCGGWVFAEP